MDLNEGFGVNFAQDFVITNLKQTHTHVVSHGHFLFFSGPSREASCIAAINGAGADICCQDNVSNTLGACESGLMEQALFAVRVVVPFSGYVTPDASVWEVAKNSKRAFVVLEGAAVGGRTLLDPSGLRVLNCDGFKSCKAVYALLAGDLRCNGFEACEGSFVDFLGSNEHAITCSGNQACETAEFIFLADSRPKLMS